MSKTDFTNLRLKHVVWRAQLEDLLKKGKASITEEQATNHKACDVGKWLYSVGMKKYGDLHEVQELEKIHVELHTTVKKVLLLRESGDIHAAKEELGKLDKILSKIMLLLVSIEENLILDRR
jgi:methyl-accepting chemotaxis protein